MVELNRGQQTVLEWVSLLLEVLFLILYVIQRVLDNRVIAQRLEQKGRTRLKSPSFSSRSSKRRRGKKEQIQIVKKYSCLGRLKRFANAGGLIMCTLTILKGIDPLANGTYSASTVFLLTNLNTTVAVVTGLRTVYITVRTNYLALRQKPPAYIKTYFYVGAFSVSFFGVLCPVLWSVGVSDNRFWTENLFIIWVDFIVFILLMIFNRGVFTLRRTIRHVRLGAAQSIASPLKNIRQFAVVVHVVAVSGVTMLTINMVQGGPFYGKQVTDYDTSNLTAYITYWVQMFVTLCFLVYHWYPIRKYRQHLDRLATHKASISRVDSEPFLTSRSNIYSESQISEESVVASSEPTLLS